jgi:hypothetical protein
MPALLLALPARPGPASPDREQPPSRQQPTGYRVGCGRPEKTAFRGRSHRDPLGADGPPLAERHRAEVEKATARAISARCRAGADFLRFAFDAPVAGEALTRRVHRLDRRTSRRGLRRRTATPGTLRAARDDRRRRAFPASTTVLGALAADFPPAELLSNTPIAERPRDAGRVPSRDGAPAAYLIAFEWALRLRRRRDRRDEEDADPDRRAEGQGRPRPLRRRDDGPPARASRSVLRHAFPVRQARPARHASGGDLQRDGERGPRHLVGVRCGTAAGETIR